MHEYKVNILKIVDGDTVDVDIDLGFGIWLRNERVRIVGIDTPESRTSDKVEKVFGLAAKARLNSLLGQEAILLSQMNKKGENMKGKFGRILGDFKTMSTGEAIGGILIYEGHAVSYDGENKEHVQQLHLENRKRLVEEGKVVLPDGMAVTKPPLVAKPVVEEVVEEAPAPVLTKEQKLAAAKSPTPMVTSDPNARMGEFDGDLLTASKVGSKESISKQSGVVKKSVTKKKKTTAKKK